MRIFVFYNKYKNVWIIIVNYYASYYIICILIFKLSLFKIKMYYKYFCVSY